MDLEWISQKGASLAAILVGLGLLALGIYDSRYRYFYLVVAIIAFVYAYKKWKKRDTPFEKREREMRRKMM